MAASTKATCRVEHSCDMLSIYVVFGLGGIKDFLTVAPDIVQSSQLRFGTGRIRVYMRRRYRRTERVTSGIQPPIILPDMFVSGPG